MGGFITMSYLGWRWTAWITLIMAAFFEILAFFICDESYTPVLLSRKAAKIRFETRNWALHAPHDERQVDMHEILNKYLYRPFLMLALEPILTLITIYMALIYGMIYLFFEAYPIAFQEQRGWNLGSRRASFPWHHHRSHSRCFYRYMEHERTIQAEDGGERGKTSS